jgi:hypothetical protein
VSLKKLSKQLLILGTALWLCPLQFRQSCWNADLVLRLRQSARVSLWKAGWFFLAALVMPVRFQWATFRALLRRAGSDTRSRTRSELAHKYELLKRASDELSTQGRVEASGTAREVQEACLRALYLELLQKEIREDAVRPMTRYHYATDAMRDLFDHCYALGRLHSTGAIAATLPQFTARLADCIARSRTEQLPRGRLPAAGYFEGTDDGESRGTAKDLLSRYWSEDHPQRLNPRPDVAAELEVEYDNARERLGTWSLRAMFCHELAMQGSIELVRSHRSATGPRDVQQLTRAMRRSFEAAERLSFTWTLPD